MKSPWINWVSPECNGILIRRQKDRRRSQKHKREWRVKIEIGATQPSLMARAVGSWEKQGNTLPQCLQREHGLLTPQFWVSGLQNWEKLNFCYLRPPSLWLVLTAAPGNETTTVTPTTTSLGACWAWSTFLSLISVNLPKKFRVEAQCSLDWWRAWSSERLSSLPWSQSWN